MKLTRRIAIAAVAGVAAAVIAAGTAVAATTASAPPPARVGCVQNGTRALVDVYENVPANFACPAGDFAVSLSGTGTAGAYHAGVLRALHEAGVKLDIAAGRGIGVVGAVFAAIDGTQRLWDEKGFWKLPAVRSLYAWHRIPRLVAFALAAACLMRPSARMNARGMRSPLGGKFWIARCVWAPHSACAGTSRTPMLSRSTRKSDVVIASSY